MRGFRTSLLAAFLLSMPAVLLGQADPTASVSNTMPTNDFGFNLPTKLGTLSYSLSGSEMIETQSAYGGGVYANTALGGNLAYLSKSEQMPFSLIYSGGLLFSTVPGYSSVETYQNLAASQVYRTKSWVFVASDAFSYLPGTPTTGISGVAGVGDVGVFPVQTGIGPTESILTNYSTRLSNGLQGSATWQTTASLDLEGSASWQVMNFLGGEAGYDNNSLEGSFGPNYRIDARNSVGAEAYYSQETYPGYKNYKIETEGAYVNFNRAWSRRLNTTFSLGPGRTHGTTFAPIPSQWNLMGNAGLTYATRTTGFTATYARSVNAGSGIIFGALSDTVTAGMTRPLNRDWVFGLDASYSHNVGLTPIAGGIPIYDTVYGGGQVSRRLTESLSVYGSYNLQWQEGNKQASLATAFSGVSNVISFGITFAPAPLVRGR